jgi:hypothetical protein
MPYQLVITVYFVIFCISFYFKPAFAKIVKKYKTPIAVLHTSLFIFAVFPKTKYFLMLVLLVSFLYSLKQLQFDFNSLSSKAISLGKKYVR